MRRPFSNASEFGDWVFSNCERCKKKYTDGWRCNIQYALDKAYMSDGKVTNNIAQRMGLLDNMDKYIWQCPEIELVGELGETQDD